ncbi:alpha/beta hydrolase fold domain-containing protein [Asanoa iriomotensis]|uniref:Lipase n=1 Tax=Asanoa iriomotensis TaxID=234613 RepID=A0ABQ4C6U0_9ACTN|nr:alpha/beta hydrolase fold domain-containing protein [Asanoa iriomotensis]GIF58485.1 lipase [Asanoa iriomotensis]
MNRRVVAQPRFTAEADGFTVVGAADELDDLATLLAGRQEPVDTALAGRLDPAVHAADLFLPLGGGPTLVRVYQAEAGPRPLLLWLHGGGFVGGSVVDLDHPCSRLARSSGRTVVSLEYRLAPEHPYPAALDDTYDALCWLAEHGRVLGGDGRLAAGGQSAGGALVAGAVLRARDEGGPRLDRQVLCYPVVDVAAEPTWAERQYLPGRPPVYAAPLRAGSLAGLPPTLVVAAGRDALRDQAEAYAGRLDDADYVEYADTPHAFLNFCGVLSAGDHAVGVISEFLSSPRPPSG